MDSVLCTWHSILRLFQQLLLLNFIVTVFGAWGLYILSQVLNFLLWDKSCQKLASSFGFLIGKFCFSFHYRSPHAIFTSLYIYSLTNLLFTSLLVHCCCVCVCVYEFQLEEYSISKFVLDTVSHTLMCLRVTWWACLNLFEIFWLSRYEAKLHFLKAILILLFWVP